MDISLPDMNGLEAARQMKSAAPSAEILLLSEHDLLPMVQEGLRVGARGYMLKSDAAHELATAICPASSILSGQRQLDFPMLFEIPAAVGAVGKVGIARVVRDFQGRWEGRKTCFWFSSLSTARLFPQPIGRRIFVVEINMIVSWFPRTPSRRPDSSWLVPCGNSGCSVPKLRSDGPGDRSRPRWSSHL